MKHNLIIVFDGACNLCEFSVNFIIRRDKSEEFKFVTAQSQTGIELQNHCAINALDLKTMILIKDGIAFTKSDAAIEIAKNLDGGWKILLFVKVIPKVLRDWAYSKIARNRYRWFDKK